MGDHPMMSGRGRLVYMADHIATNCDALGQDRAVREIAPDSLSDLAPVTHRAI